MTSMSGTEGTEHMIEANQLPDLVLLSNSQTSQPFDGPMLSSQETHFTSDTVDLADMEAMETDCVQQGYRNEVQVVIQSIPKIEDPVGSRSGHNLDDPYIESQDSHEACLEDEMMDDEQESCPSSQRSPPLHPSHLHSHHVHLLSSFLGENGDATIVPLTTMGSWAQEHCLLHQLRVIPVIKGPLISSNVGISKYIFTESSTDKPVAPAQPPCSPTHAKDSDCCAGVNSVYKNNMDLPEQSAEIKQAVASIAIEPKEDSQMSDMLADDVNRQICSTHQPMERGSPLRDNSNPMQSVRPLTAVLQPFHPPGYDLPISSHNLCQVLYQLKGSTQMLVINSTNPGQLKAVHVLPQSQLPDNKSQCIQLNPPVTAVENPAIQSTEVTGFPGKAPPMSIPQSSGLNVQQGQTGGAPTIKMAQPFSQHCASPIPFPTIRHNLTNLPPGSSMAPAPSNGSLGYTMVPTEYLAQLQPTPCAPVADNGSLASDPNIHVSSNIALARLPIITTDSRSKKPCNCTKSQCLKLYCDCFANGEFCSNCNCTNCFNNFEHEAERFKAIKACLDRNPEAFRPKIGKGMLGEIKLRHNKGCNCKRSGCLKNYCECYEAKIMCSSICKCIGCRNYEESPERRTLMSIPDPSDMGLCQPWTKFYPDIFSCRKQVTVKQERHPFTVVTCDVIDATCGCLLAQAEEAEKAHHSLSVAEHMILEEFGRCLAQILHKS